MCRTVWDRARLRACAAWRPPVGTATAAAAASVLEGKLRCMRARRRPLTMIAEVVVCWGQWAPRGGVRGRKRSSRTSSGCDLPPEGHVPAMFHRGSGRGRRKKPFSTYAGEEERGRAGGTARARQGQASGWGAKAPSGGAHGCAAAESCRALSGRCIEKKELFPFCYSGCP